MSSDLVNPIGYSTDFKYSQCINIKNILMIYKKQSLKSRVENLHSWLFSFIILMIVVNASVKAQDLDDRSRFKTVTTLDATRNDTIVISQIQMDSIGCDAFCSSTGLHSIFSFLKENIDYQSKAVEMGIQEIGRAHV